MATRTDARTAAVTIIFAHDSGNEGILKHRDHILEEKKIRNKNREFAISLIDGCFEHMEAIDALISEKLKDWAMDRISKLDKAILRVGAYEIKYTDTDVPIIINEALNIAKSLGSDEAPKFINGVLDALKSERK